VYIELKHSISICFSLLFFSFVVVYVASSPRFNGTVETVIFELNGYCYCMHVTQIDSN